MSIPVFELIGPPGSGKSSLLRHVLKSQRISKQAIILKRAIATKKPRKYLRSLQRLAFALSAKIRYFDKVFLATRDVYQYNKLVIESEKFLSAFSDYSLSLIYSQETSPLRKALIASWWADAFLDRINLEFSMQDSLACLDDEPLSYRLSVFNGLADEIKIRKYYELMPLPTGIICLQVDQDELLKRLRSRKRILSRHVHLSDNDLMGDINFSIRVAEIAMKVLEARHSPVLILDGSEDLDDNAKCVIRFIHKILSLDSF